ncbi:hypothetical protein CFC21_080304 [Triticum aestivum]|uniref:GRF-type domain-containing protein n=2 Tax=Triticum aestivum TaxID=4565 RepID=A0A3B6N1M5_WHEAT|nr:uncharacterized protein LOC123123372 [Triticum aestivum]KAF7075534.1 hypothetical protein CFC21_080304 [Triticum aestivum]
MSTSSASSSSRARRCFSGPMRSPIRYREGPLDYEPFTPCDCREKPKAAMWISWSDENPGRRYKTCYRSRRGGCEFYEWHDNPIADPFLKQLVIDLRDQVWLFERRNAALQDATRTAETEAANLSRQLSEAMESAMDSRAKMMVARVACGDVARQSGDNARVLGKNYLKNSMWVFAIALAIYMLIIVW